MSLGFDKLVDENWILGFDRHPTKCTVCTEYGHVVLQGLASGGNGVLDDRRGENAYESLRLELLVPLQSPKARESLVAGEADKE